MEPGLILILFQCFQAALPKKQATAEAHHIVWELPPDTSLSIQESYPRGPCCSMAFLGPAVITMSFPKLQSQAFSF